MQINITGRTTLEDLRRWRVANNLELTLRLDEGSHVATLVDADGGKVEGDGPTPEQAITCAVRRWTRGRAIGEALRRLVDDTERMADTYETQGRAIEARVMRSFMSYLSCCRDDWPHLGETTGGLAWGLQRDLEAEEPAPQG